MWYIAHAEPGAELYVGVKNGVTPGSFRAALAEGTVADQVHAIPVTAGDHLFIPSGRLHAIGEGLLIFEIQQNSDTTYRVFDWNRLGMDGSPRELHVEESMRCIDFSDVEPAVDTANGVILCGCDHFLIERHEIPRNESLENAVGSRFAIITVVNGTVSCEGATFGEGDFFLVPAESDKESLHAGANGASVLLTSWP